MPMKSIDNVAAGCAIGNVFSGSLASFDGLGASRPAGAFAGGLIGAFLEGYGKGLGFAGNKIGVGEAIKQALFGAIGSYAAEVLPVVQNYATVTSPIAAYVAAQWACSYS